MAEMISDFEKRWTTIERRHTEICPDCKGVGLTKRVMGDGWDRTEIIKKCNRCDGRGYL